MGCSCCKNETIEENVLPLPIHGNRMQELPMHVEQNYFGLLNLGNKSYFNAVLQALFYCQPFKNNMLQYNLINREDRVNVLTSLAELFRQLNTNEDINNAISPESLMHLICKDKPQYLENIEHDAYDFLLNFIFLLNAKLVENIKTISTTNSRTWIEQIFYGTITVSHKCLNCGVAIRHVDEQFSILDIDTKSISVVDHTLSVFDSTVLLCDDNKYNCRKICNSWQNGEKRKYLRKVPDILILHLRRYQYNKGFGEIKKFGNKVEIPLYLQSPNTCKGISGKSWELIAAIMHCTDKNNECHYNTIVKIDNTFKLFDDQQMSTVDESVIQDYYSTSDYESRTAYILFYKTTS